MPIRFKCPHCKKSLSVKEHLAGKKAACPVCKKGLKIPPVPPSAAPSVDIEALAASALSDTPPAKAADKAPAKPQFIDLTCPFCAEDVRFDAELAGKQAPCPECKRIIKVPLLKQDKPKDWREVDKKGPSGALVNQPGQLEGAWGSATDKGKVSQAALEEADAFIDEEEPPSLGRRIKRVLIVAAVAGVAFLVVSNTMRKSGENRRGDALAQALAYLPEGDKETKIKLPPLWTAEIQRGAGEYYVHARKVAKARLYFQGALAGFPDHFESDAFCINLARSIIEMGGSPEEAENKKDPERYEWKDEMLTKPLERTVQKIQDPDARWYALQEIGSELLERVRAPWRSVWVISSRGAAPIPRSCRR
jgi:hypothetical protein